MGSLLSEQKLQELKPWMDWIGISIDSLKEETETTLGRGNGKHVKDSIRVCHAIRNERIKLKINTVVTKLNFKEDMRPLVADLRPLRWKVFQMLVISGQNEEYLNDLKTTKEEFEIFKKTNSDIVLESGQSPTFESSEDMVDSYLMLAPDGNIIKNSNQEYSYVPLEKALASGLSGIVSEVAYRKRGGRYDWD